MAEELGMNIPSSELYERHALGGELAQDLGGTVFAAAEGQTGSVVVSPVDIHPGMAMVKNAENARKEQEAIAAERIEAIRELEKDDFNLGDLNPLIHPTDLTRRESVDAVKHIIVEKIQENDGLMPTVLESTVAIDPEAGKSALRFVARFEVPALTEEQLVLLEELVGQTYGVAVRTRTDSKGHDMPTQNYPPTQPGEEMKSKTGGWYMGPEPLPNSSLHQGLYVFQDLGQINKNNFLQSRVETGKYIIEIREASQYQTDLVTFVAQVASVLGQEKLPDRGQLLYETYYDLMRLGLKKAEKGSIYGMDDAIDMIRRELILPLANPNISRGVGEDPQSVLMIGVPGTGKTFIVEGLLQEETGVLILPIDPFELQKELALPVEKQSLMPRIAEVARITGKQVVLHVDDIENMVDEKEKTNSTILNLMAGVKKSGFYVIASANYPERINQSLIQPQRFSVLIHCGLQNERARYEILKIHANLESNRLSLPLFESEEIRDIILEEVARNTDGFTPRYLSNIATIAKSHLVARVAKEQGRTIGLTEEDLAGHAFVPEDWDAALAEVASKYDSQSVKNRDKELSDFVKKRSQGMGFAASSTAGIRILSPSVLERVAAARARLGEAAARASSEIE